DALERLVDIDAYDYRNQERLEKLRGKADDAYLKRVASRLTRSGTNVSSPDPTPSSSAGRGGGEAAPPVTEEGQRMQALEDLIVQTEIFLQYSLQAKAIDRLQKIAEMFPGEEETNSRLKNLYQAANWWPKGVPPRKADTKTGAAAPLESSQAA